MLTSTTGRRPKESDSVPWKSIITAKARRYSDRVCCTSTAETARSACIAGNDGR